MNAERLRSLLPHLFLNVGTLLVVALILLVYKTWAAPTITLVPPAAIPTFIPYQGTLSDAGGRRFNGSVNIVFRLYNVVTGGTPLWSESHPDVTVENGLFQTRLGNLTPIPAAVWNNTPLYLGVQIGNDLEMTPREQVGVVPYAIAAQTANLALTVPDGTITTTHIADGAVTSEKLASNVVDEKVYTLVLTNTVNTTSSTEAVFGTIDLPVKSNLFITSMWILQNNSSGEGLAATLTLDGVNYPIYSLMQRDDVPLSAQGIGYTIARNHYIPNVSAGQHTLGVRIGQAAFHSGDTVNIVTPSVMWVRAVPVRQ